MNKLQQLYIHILTPVAGVMEKTPLGSQGRQRGIGICSFLLAAVFLIQYPYRYSPWPAVSYPNNATAWVLIGSVLLVIIIVLSVEKGMKPLKSCKVFGVAFIGTAALILASSFLHYIGEGWRPFALSMLIVFPVFYLVYMGTGQWEAVFKAFSWGLMIYGYTLVVSSLIINPPDLDNPVSRYTGMTGNAAYFAMSMMPAVVGGLYLAIKCRSKSIKISALLLVCLATLFLVLTGTRAALSGAVFAEIVAVIIVMKLRRHGKEEHDSSGRKNVYRGLIIAVVAVIVVLLLLLSDAGKALLEYFSRFDMTGKTLNRFLAGRWDLWVEAFSRLNFIGHDYSTDPLIINDKYMYGTHNFPLEVAYRSGIIAGVFYLAMEILCLAFLFGRLFKKGTVKAEHIFPCLIIPAFFAVSMFEWDLRMFSALHVLCFFISLGPVMFKKDSGPENRDIIP